LLGNGVCLVYRHFPLATVHPYAEKAAEAAEAAGAQGAFWRMHDTLFENQAALDEDSLLDHAEALGLDVVRFGHELLTNQYLPRVREDFMGGVRSGVNGTPAFFVDGERYDGPLDVASLDTALRQSMGEKTR
jgi:protein-disulfide isomerase